MRKIAILALGALALGVLPNDQTWSSPRFAPLGSPVDLEAAIAQGLRWPLRTGPSSSSASSSSLLPDDQASPDVGVAVARRIVNDPDLWATTGAAGVAIPASEICKDTITW